MPVPARQDSPALNRFSRTPASDKVAATIATTGVVTVASGALNGHQTGDLCMLVETTPGTAITGGTGGTTPIDRTQLYAIEITSATTCNLYKGGITGARVTNLGVAVTANASLLFGDPSNTDLSSRNLVPMNSVAGGNGGQGPLD